MAEDDRLHVCSKINDQETIILTTKYVEVMLGNNNTKNNASNTIPEL